MQLGVHLDFRVPDDVQRLTAAAREAGFTAIQFSPTGLEINDHTVAAIQTACATAGLEIVSAAGYANPLRPSDSSTGFTVGKELQLARALRRLRVSKLVVRSGTFGATLHDPDPRNGEADAWQAAVGHVRALEQICAGGGSELLVEPHFAHVLSSVEACERFLGEMGGDRVKLVLDPPNLVAPALFDKRDAIIDDVLKKLARRSGLIHFKDYRQRPDGTIEYLPAGSGVLDYKRLVTAIIRSGYAGPGIVECTEPATMAAVRAFVEPLVAVI
ncbi:MAG: sugar phosphate isomerase/epimerase [Planctomycetes bacterium]|nr:sugar phosphate isomerase/epimerase [Planctomycetota bacterium]MBI3845369.1 sugar phosphate isomerase/epimerase [Planctomycetota bacterium]